MQQIDNLSDAICDTECWKILICLSNSLLFADLIQYNHDERDRQEVGLQEDLQDDGAEHQELRRADWRGASWT